MAQYMHIIDGTLDLRCSMSLSLLPHLGNLSHSLASIWKVMIKRVCCSVLCGCVLVHECASMLFREFVDSPWKSLCLSLSLSLSTQFGKLSPLKRVCCCIMCWCVLLWGGYM